MNITIIAVDEEKGIPGKKPGTSYDKLTVTYKDQDNKVASKQLFSFTAKDVYQTLLKAEKGDTFSIDMEKENGYWTWKAVHRQDGTVKSETTVNTYKPSYETAEDRAKKQIYIIRQSSISSAVELLKDHGTPEERSPEAVLAVAKQFVNFVLGDDNV